MALAGGANTGAHGDDPAFRRRLHWIYGVYTLGLIAFIVVMALLRMALGTGQTPSNQILVGLALFITMMVMMPVPIRA